MKGVPEFRAGVARRDISPDKPELLAPTGMVRLVPTRGVLDPLYVEALALELDGELAFLTTSDLRVIPPSWAVEIRRRVAERTGCDPRRVLLSATHNHCSSPELPGDSLLGQIPGSLKENRSRAEAALTESTARICDGFVESCSEAWANLQPAEFAAASVPLQTPMAENRRMRLSNGTCVTGWGAGPVAPPGEKYVEPAGSSDSNIVIGAWRHVGAQEPFAVLTSFSSHIHLYELPWFSGEIAGACKRAIQSRVAGSIALYANGTGGDVDMHCVHPIAPGDEDAAVRWFRDSAALLGGRFADAVVPALRTSLAYRRPLRIAHEYFSIGEDAEEVRRITVINALLLDDVAFLTIPGEMFVEFGLRMARENPVKHLVLMGYNGSDAWYIPTLLAIEQGSYETMRGYARTAADELTTNPAGKTIASRLPRLDDGARIVDQALAMLRRLARWEAPA